MKKLTIKAHAFMAALLCATGVWADYAQWKTAAGIENWRGTTSQAFHVSTVQRTILGDDGSLTAGDEYTMTNDNTAETTWKRYASNQSVYSAPGMALRYDTYGYNSASDAQFTPLSFGGLIVESLADEEGTIEYSIVGTGSRSTELGKADYTTYFKFDKSFTINRQGTTSILGTANVEVADGAVFKAQAYSDQGVTVASGSTLIMSGEGTMIPGTGLTASGATLDYTALDGRENATAFIDGNLTINNATVIKLPASVGVDTSYQLCSGTLSGGTLGYRTVYVGTESKVVLAKFTDNTISYSLPVDPTPIHWWTFEQDGSDVGTSSSKITFNTDNLITVSRTSGIGENKAEVAPSGWSDTCPVSSTEGFTIAMSLKLDTGSNKAMFGIGAAANTSSTKTGFCFATGDEGTFKVLSMSGSTPTEFISYTPTTGTLRYHYYVLTCTSDKVVKLYVDGKQVNTEQTYTYQNDLPTLGVQMSGYHGATPSGYTNTNLDFCLEDLKTFDGVLTDDQIKVLADDYPVYPEVTREPMELVFDGTTTSFSGKGYDSEGNLVDFCVGDTLVFTNDVTDAVIYISHETGVSNIRVADGVTIHYGQASSQSFADASQVVLGEGAKLVLRKWDSNWNSLTVCNKMSITGSGTVEFACDPTSIGTITSEAGVTFDINGKTVNGVISGGTITGSGTINMSGTIPNCTLGTDWTGTINVGAVSGNMTSITSLVNANSTVQLTATGGYIAGGTDGATFSGTLKTDGSVTFNNGGNGMTVNIAKLAGSGTFNFNRWNSATATYKITDSVADFTGTVSITVGITFVAPAEMTVTTSSDGYKVVETAKEDGTYEYVAKTLEEIFAAEVAAANASTEAVTITLSDDITLANRYTFSGTGAVTLDLNGHTLTGGDGNGSVITVTNGAKLTVTGISGGITSEAAPYIFGVSGGTLVIDGGAFSGGTTATILSVGDGSSITVNGGSISGVCGIFIEKDAGTVAVTGGTITKTASAESGDMAAIYANSGTVTISGGSVLVAEGVSASSVAKWGDSPSISIIGGSFTTDPSDYVATGYEATKDATSGLYVVAEAVAKPIAKVGEDEYFTLAAAFDAVAENGTVTLLADYESEIIPTKAMTLDLGAKTVGDITIAGVAVTVQNGTASTITIGEKGELVVNGTSIKNTSKVVLASTDAKATYVGKTDTVTPTVAADLADGYQVDISYNETTSTSTYTLIEKSAAAVRVNDVVVAPDADGNYTIDVTTSGAVITIDDGITGKITINMTSATTGYALYNSSDVTPTVKYIADGTYNVTKYVKATTDWTGTTIALDSEMVPAFAITEDGEDDDITAGVVTVESIPGLVYRLVGASTLEGLKTASAITAVTATGATTTLNAGDDAITTASGFYKVTVDLK